MQESVLIIKVTKSQMEGAHAVTGCRCFVELVGGKHQGYFVERKVESRQSPRRVKRQGIERRPGIGLDVRLILNRNQGHAPFAPNSQLGRAAKFVEDLLVKRLDGLTRRELAEELEMKLGCDWQRANSIMSELCMRRKFLVPV